MFRSRFPNPILLRIFFSPDFFWRTENFVSFLFRRKTNFLFRFGESEVRPRVFNPIRDSKPIFCISPQRKFIEIRSPGFESRLCCFSLLYGLRTVVRSNPSSTNNRCLVKYYKNHWNSTVTEQNDYGSNSVGRVSFQRSLKEVQLSDVGSNPSRGIRR